MYHFCFFLFLVSVPLVHPYEIYHYRDVRNMKQYHPDSRPRTENFQVIPLVHGYHKNRDSHRVLQLTCFNKSITLYLEPTDGHLAGQRTPVFVAKSGNNRNASVQYKRLNNVMRVNAQFFHNKHYLAALSIEHDENGMPLVHGTIGDKAIQPIPSRLRKKFYKKYKRSADDNKIPCNDCDNYHKIDYTHDHVLTKINVVRNANTNKTSAVVKISKPEDPKNVMLNLLPPVIHPELLILMDWSLFNVFYRNVDAAVEYLLAYWNGVDLRYRAFLDPSIRLNIAGIVLAQDVGAIPYIANNIVNVKGYHGKRKLMNYNGILDEGPRYLYNETRYDDKHFLMWMKKLNLEYDAVITMTANNLCDNIPVCPSPDREECFEPQDLDFYCDAKGNAFYLGACAFDPKEKKMEAFAVLEDFGDFSSIVPSTHEVGHLLGASHNVRNKYQCPSFDGYIMSFRLGMTEKNFHWSNCSMYSIKGFLQEHERAQCLFNRPAIGTKLPRILPGEVFNRDELCHRIMKTKSCTEEKYTSDCVQLYCLSENGRCQAVHQVLVPEGLSCGTEKYCIDGKCISKNQHVVTLEVGETSPEKPLLKKLSFIY